MDALLPHILVYFSAMFAAVILTPAAIRFAPKLGMIDEPDARKVHDQIMPRNGGIAIAIAFLVALFVHWFISPIQIRWVPPFSEILILLAMSISVLFLGALDDIHNVPAKLKLVVLLMASLTLAASGARIPLTLFGISLPESCEWLNWPLTVLWILGITISVNFIDGLDGLAAGIVAIAAMALAVGAASHGVVLASLIALALAGSLSGFIFFNFNPARIFMGDSGSMFIGFILAGCSVVVAADIKDASVTILTAMAMSVPLLDALLTLVRRGVLQRRSLFSAERGHIHHRLLDMGVRQRHAVFLLYSATGVAATGGLAMFLGSALLATAVGLLAIGTVLILFNRSGSTQLRETARAINRNRSYRRERAIYQYAFEAMQLRFANTRCFSDWWQETCATATKLNFARLELPLPKRDGTIRVLTWEIEPLKSEKELPILRVTFPVQHRRADQLPLVISGDVLVDKGLELAGMRITIFLRLMYEHSLRNLPSQSDERHYKAPGRIKTTTELFNGGNESGSSIPYVQPELSSTE